MKKETRQKGREVGIIEVSRIGVNSNIREVFDAAEMKELKDNIAKVGILQPLLLRKIEDGAYLLVAGERRLRAAKSLGMENVPAIISVMTDKEAAKLQTYENLHRADLTPLEQARAFRRLMDDGEGIKELSAEVGKSETFVYRSIRLLELSLRGITALESGQITVAVALQVLRVAPDKRDELINFATSKAFGAKPTYEDILRKIERDIRRNLNEAWFPLDVAGYGGQIACTACPHNSGNQNMLFDGASKGLCHNGKCYSVKTRAFEKIIQAKGAKKYPGLKFLGSASAPYDEHEAGSIGTGIVVTDSVAKPKVVARALKEKPESFAFGIQKPNRLRGTRSKPRVVLLCLKPAALGLRGVKAKAPQPGQPAGAYQSKVDYALEHKIEVEVSRRIGQHVWLRLNPMPDAMLWNRVMDYFIDQAWGSPGEIIKEIKGVKDSRQVVNFLLYDEDDLIKCAEKMGLKVKDVRKKVAEEMSKSAEEKKK